MNGHVKRTEDERLPNIVEESSETTDKETDNMARATTKSVLKEDGYDDGEAKDVQGFCEFLDSYYISTKIFGVIC
jgi:hypothetical protein